MYQYISTLQLPRCVCCVGHATFLGWRSLTRALGVNCGAVAAYAMPWAGGHAALAQHPEGQARAGSLLQMPQRHHAARVVSA